MTTAGRNRKLRRRSVTLRAISRDAGGQISMIEFSLYEKSPIAPSIFVSRIGGIYRVNPHITRVTLCQLVPIINAEPKLTEAVNLIWENSDWDAAFDGFGWAHAEVRKGTFVPDDGGGRRSRTQ
jgi:hypothetical protein